MLSNELLAFSCIYLSEKLILTDWNVTLMTGTSWGERISAQN